MRALLLACLLACCASVHGVVEVHRFDSEEQRLRYLEFTRELRCPKCQNQNLADSNAPIATDLRRELYRLLGEGKSDAEIIEFMVNRYGDYVLYKPAVEPRTWLLWTAPLLLLGAGAVVVLVLLRRSRRDRVAAAQPGAGKESLDAQERQRLAELLDEGEAR